MSNNANFTNHNDFIAIEKDYLKLLQSAFSTSNFDLLINVITNNTQYISECSGVYVKGVDKIISQFKKEFASNNNIPYIGSISYINCNNDEDLEYKIGKQCIAISYDIENKVNPICFIDLDSDENIKRIFIAEDDRYVFEIDKNSSNLDSSNDAPKKLCDIILVAAQSCGLLYDSDKYENIKSSILKYSLLDAISITALDKAKKEFSDIDDTDELYANILGYLFVDSIKRYADIDFMTGKNEDTVVFLNYSDAFNGIVPEPYYDLFHLARLFFDDYTSFILENDLEDYNLSILEESCTIVQVLGQHYAKTTFDTLPSLQEILELNKRLPNPEYNSDEINEDSDLLSIISDFNKIYDIPHLPIVKIKKILSNCKPELRENYLELIKTANKNPTAEIFIKLSDSIASAAASYRWYVYGDSPICQRMRETILEPSLYWTLQAIKSGYDNAFYKEYQLISSGAGDIPYNKSFVKTLLLYCAKNNNVSAMMSIARQYSSSITINSREFPYNLEKADYWVEKINLLNDSNTYEFLGDFYLREKQDYKKALFYYSNLVDIGKYSYYADMIYCHYLLGEKEKCVNYIRHVNDMRDAKICLMVYKIMCRDGWLYIDNIDLERRLLKTSADYGNAKAAELLAKNYKKSLIGGYKRVSDWGKRDILSHRII